MLANFALESKIDFYVMENHDCIISLSTEDSKNKMILNCQKLSQNKELILALCIQYMSSSSTCYLLKMTTNHRIKEQICNCAAIF